jgi:hypothetical protein
VYLHSTGNNTTWHHRKLKQFSHHSSNLGVANKLLETLSTEHSSRISVFHDVGINLTDSNAKKSHSYVIFIVSVQVLNEGIYRTLRALNFQSMWNSKTNFLVVITDHVKDSAEGIAMKVLEK